MSDPDEPMSEALQIVRHPDPRLVYEPQGATWNFPAARAGELRCQLRLVRGFQGARICLLDRWVSPDDPAVDLYKELPPNVKDARDRETLWGLIALPPRDFRAVIVEAGEYKPSYNPWP